MSRDFKKYGLRQTSRPARNELVSTCAAVFDDAGKYGYAYINFEKAFVEAVGRALPRGITNSDPAYIEINFNSRTQKWAVSARYFLTEESALLWESVDRPAWLKTVHGNGVKNGNKTRALSSAERIAHDDRAGTSHSSSDPGCGATGIAFATAG